MFNFIEEWDITPARLSVELEKAVFQHKTQVDGSLYVDDGESLQPSVTLDITFAATSRQLKVDVQGGYKDNNTLGNVNIMGVTGGCGPVKLNGQAIDAAKVHYNQTSSVLKLSGLNDLTKVGAWQGSWTLSWA